MGYSTANFMVGRGRKRSVRTKKLQQVVNHENDQVWSSSLVEGRIVMRRQNAQSVILWVAVTATGKLVFVPCGVKLISERYISLILESKLLPWATEHLHGSPWNCQQDSAPSHGSNVTQTWIQRNIPSFISKDVWLARSPDLILETRVLAIPHTSLESLKAKLQREWEAISQEQIHAACDAFVNRLEAVVRNNGSYIE
ncbi:hypothetical protein FHG87_015606 [Trinorchestia longiramus]|nr:hypothetical protein FHG87_015606 [Trinorchestia longiramus]